MDSLARHSINDLQETPKFNQDADKLVIEWMDSVKEGFHPGEYERDINQVLFTKRHQGKDVEDYIHLLIDNIAYSMETEDRMLDLIPQILSENLPPQFSKITEAIDAILEKAKINIKPRAEKLRESYERDFESKRERKSAVEYDYARNYLAQNLIRDSLKHLCSEPLLLRKIRKFPAEDIKTILKYYINIYSINLMKEIEL